MWSLLAQANPDVDQSFFGVIKAPEAIAGGYGTTGGLIAFISNMLNVLIIVGGLITLFNVVMAGYIYLTAAGDTKAHEKVVGKLTMSLYGLALMVLAPALMAIVGFLFFKSPTFFLKPIITGPSQTQNGGGTSGGGGGNGSFSDGKGSNKLGPAVIQ